MLSYFVKQWDRSDHGKDHSDVVRQETAWILDLKQ